MPVHLMMLLALGCAGDGSDTDTPAGDTDTDVTIPDLDPAIEVGTGENEFEPLTDGDDIYIVQGPQGGFHFNGSVRVQGIEPGDPGDLFAPDNPTTVWRAFDGEMQVDVGIDATQGLDPVPDEPGVYQTIGRKVILDIARDDVLDGNTVRLQVEVTDIDGVNLIDERTLTAIPHPLNE